MLLVNFFKLTLLCGILAAVRGNEAYFSWSDFRGKSGDKETVADFEKVHLQSVKRDSDEILYPCGQFTFTQDLDADMRIVNVLKHEDIYTIYSSSSPCDSGFRESFVLPLTKGHSDFEHANECPQAKGTFSFDKVDDWKKLIASTNLPPGSYDIDVTLMKKDGSNIGGFAGHFNCVIP